MKSFFIIAGLGVLIFGTLFIMGNAIEGANLAQYEFWAPKEQAAMRRVYQQTPSYVNGNLADLRNLRDQIILQKDPEVKGELQAGLRDKLNHLPADFAVPADVSAAATN